MRKSRIVNGFCERSLTDFASCHVFGELGLIGIQAEAGWAGDPDHVSRAEY
jgi:hypothetical protein